MSPADSLRKKLSTGTCALATSNAPIDFLPRYDNVQQLGRSSMLKVHRLLFVPLLFAPFAIAQTTGAIEGAITDPTGAAIPGATVKLTNENTGVVSTTTTNPAGQYLFDNLTIGKYQIDVNQAGFKAYSVKDIRVDANARVRRDVALTVGAVQENVTVEAAASPVQTAEGTVSSLITTEQIDTAVLNGRNYSKLAMLMPGAVYNSGSDELSGAGLNAPAAPVSINGLNNKTSGWFVDGAYDMNVGNGDANQHVPVLDTIQE